MFDGCVGVCLTKCKNSCLLIEQIYSQRNSMYAGWQKSNKANKKILLQKKMKNNPHQYSDRIQTQQSLPRESFITKKHHHTEASEREDQFQKTMSRLTESNFGHHHPSHCLCAQCDCGRHLCKMHIVKPDFTKSSVYRRSFNHQQAVQSQVLIAKQYDKLKGPHLDMQSTYHKGFIGRHPDDLERPHPKDLLESSGPAPQLTSYACQFPGHHGDNQYVKPTDRHTRGPIPFRSKSTYSRVFVRKPLEHDNYKYMADQLKTGYDWLGQSTYGSKFAKPNPEYFAKKVTVVEKKDETVKDNIQFKTTYKNDFVKKEVAVCPAKVHLEGARGRSYSAQKGCFSENSDFKSMNRNFHAFSTSKHACV